MNSSVTQTDSDYIHCLQLNATPPVKGPGKLIQTSPSTKGPPSWRKGAEGAEPQRHFSCQWTSCGLAEPLGSLGFSSPTRGAEKLDGMIYKFSPILWFFYIHVLIQSQISFWFAHIQKQLRVMLTPRRYAAVCNAHMESNAVAICSCEGTKALFKNPVSCWDHPEEKSYWPDNHMLHEAYDLKAFLPENNKQ